VLVTYSIEWSDFTPVWLNWEELAKQIAVAREALEAATLGSDFGWVETSQQATMYEQLRSSIVDMLTQLEKAYGDDAEYLQRLNSDYAMSHEHAIVQYDIAYRAAIPEG
jgi:hypothetical protein